MGNSINVAGVTVSADHYINGQRVEGEEYIDLHCPIDQSLLGQIANGSPKVVEKALDAAESAFPAWAALTRTERKVYLDRFADEIEKRAEQLCLLESNDAGVLLSRMRHGVAARAVLNIRYFAEKALDLDNREIDTDKATHMVHHDPAGVTVIITPWNSPLMLSTWKLGRSSREYENNHCRPHGIT
jgi:acyl-CoA reductase-like NAD-dependent aldehyde dehydrogenase